MESKRWMASHRNGTGTGPAFSAVRSSLGPRDHVGKRICCAGRLGHGTHSCSQEFCSSSPSLLSCFLASYPPRPVCHAMRLTSRLKHMRVSLVLYRYAFCSHARRVGEPRRRVLVASDSVTRTRTYCNVVIIPGPPTTTLLHTMIGPPTILLLVVPCEYSTSTVLVPGTVRVQYCVLF